MLKPPLDQEEKTEGLTGSVHRCQRLARGERKEKRSLAEETSWQVAVKLSRECVGHPCCAGHLGYAVMGLLGWHREAGVTSLSRHKDVGVSMQWLLQPQDLRKHRKSLMLSSVTREKQR